MSDDKLIDGEMAVMKVVSGSKKAWWVCDAHELRKYPFPRSRSSVIEAFKEETGKKYHRVNGYDTTMKPSEAAMTVAQICDLKVETEELPALGSAVEVQLFPSVSAYQKKVVTKFPKRKAYA